jgi:PAS domain S-box-containing protein
MIASLQNRFRNVSIRGKVMLVTVTACLIALFSAVAGLYIFQLRHFRGTFARELRALSKVMADNCAVALAFDDAKTAKEVLSPLSVKPEIKNASVLNRDGKTFALFGGENMNAKPDFGVPASIEDRGATWTVVEPVIMDGKRIGTFFMDVDFAKPRRELLGLFFNVTLVVLAGSTILVVLLTMQLQKFITQPIQSLASASRAVARDRDYSVRVGQRGEDEVGMLTEAFNAMLAQIQKQDAELQAAQAELRARAEAAQAQLAAIIDATPDFVGNATPGGAALYVNPAGRRMIGLGAEEDIFRMNIADFHPAWAGRVIAGEGVPAAIRDGSWVGETAVLHRDGREIPVSQLIIAHKDTEGGLHHLSTVMTDISKRKASEEALRLSQEKLLTASRFAGMAEVATGVLHNVGNVLNSVNVSVGVVLKKLRASKAAKLSQAAELLTGQNGNLAEYLTQDDGGRKLPAYLAKLGRFMLEENAALLAEVDQLSHNIEHIKEVVAMQQSYAKVSGVFEDLPLDRLVEDAIAMNAGALERHCITLERRFSDAPLARVDRHRVLQILINLIRNAKYALDEVERTDKAITLIVAPSGAGGVRVSVADNGIGILPENLTRIFGHGFTTRKDGHGFGLHSGALAAQEMGGSLSVHSDGHRCGAIFTLELPAAPTAIHP